MIDTVRMVSFYVQSFSFMQSLSLIANVLFRAIWRLAVSRCMRTLLGGTLKWAWHKSQPWRSAKAITVITKLWFVIFPGFIILPPPCNKGKTDKKTYNSMFHDVKFTLSYIQIQQIPAHISSDIQSDSFVFICPGFVIWDLPAHQHTDNSFMGPINFPLWKKVVNLKTDHSNVCRSSRQQGH